MGDYSDWLDAGGWSGMQVIFQRRHDGFEILHLNILLVARAQFAVERSYQRLTDAAAVQGVEGAFLQCLEAHAFLVSADLFWDALAEVSKKIRPQLFPELQAAIDRNKQHRADLKTARNHIEHVTERVRDGRPPRHGPVMTKDVFRQAMGQIDGNKIKFGDESFDLADQFRAIVDVRDSVAKRLGDAMTMTFTVTTS